MMMNKSRRKINSDKQSLSLLQSDKQFVKKILARNSSVGSNSSIITDNFRASAEVPFKWESRPGEPKDKSISVDLFPPATFKDRPKRVDYFAQAPTTVDPLPPSTGGGAGGGPRPSTRARVRYFWKKLVEKGQKRFSSRKNENQPPAAAETFSSAVAGARGYHSAEIGLHRSDDHNQGFSRGSVSGSSSPNGYNLRLERSSKIQSFTWGFIKWVV